MALRLAQLGAKVIAVSKSDENLKQLVAEVWNGGFDLLIGMFLLEQQYCSSMCWFNWLESD